MLYIQSTQFILFQYYVKSTVTTPIHILQIRYLRVKSNCFKKCSYCFFSLKLELNSLYNKSQIGLKTANIRGEYGPFTCPHNQCKIKHLESFGFKWKMSFYSCLETNSSGIGMARGAKWPIWNFFFQSCPLHWLGQFKYCFRILFCYWLLFMWVNCPILFTALKQTIQTLP